VIAEVGRYQDTRYPARGPFPYLEVRGSHYEMGLQHGRGLKDRVDASVAIYRDKFAEAGLDWVTVHDLAKEILGDVVAYDAGLASELEGIAAGSGHDLLTIIAINSRSEILTLAGRRTALAKEHSCTSVACLPEATGGHTLLGRNWDQDLRLLDNAVVINARPSADPAFVMLTEAGILLRDGVNEHGIGVTGNSLYCDQDGGDAKGMPAGMVRRKALKHSSLAKAVKVAMEAPTSTSINHLFAAAGGGAIDIEAAPHDVFWLLPEDGLVTHSNHFRSPSAAVRVKDTGPLKAPSTLYRYARVEQVLRPKHGSIGVDDVRGALNDHFGWPDSVCSHPKPGEQHPTGSVATIVMDLDARTMHVAAHPVCQSEWTRYALG
jgi:isopenicillin-N N-acyltransferase-like protein